MPAPDLVTYQSDGKLLIIDQVRPESDRARAIRIARDLVSAGIRPTVLLRNIDADELDALIDQESPGEDVPVVSGGKVELSGFLGQFSAQFDVAGKNNFDLVLDLCSPACLRYEVRPLGYYAPGVDPEKLRSALLEIPQMTGGFGKPVFVNYQAGICAHSRKGIIGCTRCLDCCPAEAILDSGDKITVNTSLCQGCGSCTMACPTGALSYIYPTVQDWLLKVRNLLAEHRESGAAQADLLVYDANSKSALSDPAVTRLEQLIPVEIEAIGSVGMDAWLAALAYGAGHVVLLIGCDTPMRVLKVIRFYLSVVQSLLAGMGYSKDRVQVIELNGDGTLSIDPEVGHSYGNHPAAVFEPFEKRRTIRLAMDHLYQYAPGPQELTTLPEGSTFSGVQVDQTTCTLCMSCVEICPMQALQQDAKQLQLSFLETNCVQCGLCGNACPEDSITPVSRYLYDEAQAGKPRLLNEDTPFCCIVCGKPFISKRMFDTINERLAASGNWSVSDDVTPDWLKMCGDCRVK